MTSKKSTKRKKIIAFVIILLSLATILCLTMLYFYNLIYNPYKGYSDVKQFVLIKKGSTVNGIVRSLVAAGVLENELGFKIILKFKGGGTNLIAGEYLFDRAMSPLEVYEKFRKGDVHYHRFTIPEGKDIYEIAEAAERIGVGNYEEFLKAFSNIALVKDIDPGAENLEGYLFPDTYLVSRIMSAEEITAKMVANFKEHYNSYLKAFFKDTKLNLRRIVIIASLIEKETQLPEERSTISSVIYNRLRIGMGLQIDPTIIYALKQTGQYDGNLKREHKSLDSPYNTYKYRGLPPSPICNPGIGALIAAVNPTQTKFLYYVSRNDGSHVFSTNVDDHNKAVYIWQKKYWRDKWRSEKNAGDAPIGARQEQKTQSKPALKDQKQEKTPKSPEKKNKET